MKLTKILAGGFRALEDICVNVDNLTVLIGENDSGKSSLLDLIEMFLTNRRPVLDDFYRSPENKQNSDRIEVTLTFSKYEDDLELEEFFCGDELIVKKTFHHDGGEETSYFGESFEDERLDIIISSLPAPEQKDLIRKLDPAVEDDAISNQAKRREWITRFKEQASKVSDWIEAPSDFQNLLPRFERYSAMDYNDPANVVAKTLRQVFEHTIYESLEKSGVEGSRRLIEPLRTVQNHARKNIKEKIMELETHITRYNTGINEISYEPKFNFEGSLQTGEFLLDRGYGLHALSRIGDGTKRRMFMAVTDWDREVTLEQTRSGASLPFIIRGYDEPDTNLHYDAQRLMFHSISDIVMQEQSRVQAILCTHSLTMIDRAPAQIIRTFSLDRNGCTLVDQLQTDGDLEIEDFLNNLARELGITNSIMFYERCFILVEGDTEDHALPIIYRRVYERSLIEDCIRIMNVKSNSAVREFLKLLRKNRKHLLVIFIDSDSENRKDANLTHQSLKELGFDDDFIDQQFIFVGEKEFEDAFSNLAIVGALEERWPKADGSEWVIDEIEKIRETDKFSDGIRKLVWDQTADDGSKWTKPIFGRILAESCTIEEIPKEIIDLFVKAREIAGVYD